MNTTTAITNIHIKKRLWLILWKSLSYFLPVPQSISNHYPEKEEGYNEISFGEQSKLVLREALDRKAFHRLHNIGKILQ